MCLPIFLAGCGQAGPGACASCAATIANARADGHLVRKVYSYQSADKRDCLHYCLPGPPDVYNLVLKRVLAGLRHPRS